MKILATPDPAKSKALLEMAKVSMRRLAEIDGQKYPSNTLTDYYDILHKCMDALVCLEGVKIKGEGAHQELIDYISKRHGLGEAVRRFLQELREYRNRIAYEGFTVTKEYITSNTRRIEDILQLLMSLCKLD